MTRKVLCFGTFDLLHLGHLHYFKQAKQYGDYLIVVIARDKTKTRQGKSTVFSETERLELIKSLKIVDDAKMGYPDNHFQIITEIKPDVICLGYDHQISERELHQKLLSFGLNPKIKRMLPYNQNRQKSSKLKKLILNS